ncbi:36684_t:CDS:2, partial [Gigaspora margarita]
SQHRYENTKLKKVSSTEMSNKPIMDISELEILSNPWEPTITHTILQESAFTNVSHGKIKTGDIDGYKEVVKKYLQVGQLYKIPNSSSWSSLLQTLNYIKEFYQEIYEKEEIDMEAVSQLIENMVQVSMEQNLTLIKTITEKEIAQTINKGEIIVPLLAKLFNEVLTSSQIPSHGARALS